jgi:type VII secretion effector (TIGR04197 family)
VADLQVNNATMTQARAALHAAADRLAPVVRAVQCLDDQVVGTNALESMLADANPTLAARLQIIGQALTELAAHVSQANASYGETDQKLSQSLGAGSSS